MHKHKLGTAPKLSYTQAHASHPAKSLQCCHSVHRFCLGWATPNLWLQTNHAVAQKPNGLPMNLFLIWIIWSVHSESHSWHREFYRTIFVARAMDEIPPCWFLTYKSWVHCCLLSLCAPVSTDSIQTQCATNNASTACNKGHTWYTQIEVCASQVCVERLEGFCLQL